MKIEGLAGCFEKTGGLFYFARMCSKIRLYASGKLPTDYHELLGKGFDGRTCRYLKVEYRGGQKPGACWKNRRGSFGLVFRKRPPAH